MSNDFRVAEIDHAFAHANLRCTVCGAKRGECDCYERCTCGWIARRGQQCDNPETIRCSTKMKYGRWNPRTRRYDPAGE